MKKENQYLALCSITHLLVDLSCAWLMISRISALDWWYPALLLYNFLAFALQMPLGILVDAKNHQSLFAASGCLLTALSLLTVLPAPAAVLFAGCGNALFHVGGGADMLRFSGGTCFYPGTFVSTGAIGLFTGRFLALKSSSVFILTPVFLLLILCGILILCTLPGRKSQYASAQRQNPAYSSHVPVLTAKSGLKILLCLLSVVCLRSYQGMVLSFSWNTGLLTTFFLIFVTALGKFLGGICADRWGLRKISVFSLLIAAFLFLFPSWRMAGLAAVLCFNMTMPVTLTALHRLMPQKPGFSFGLLTFALFLGFLPVYLGYTPSGSSFPSLLSLLSLFLLWNGLRHVQT